MLLSQPARGRLSQNFITSDSAPSRIAQKVAKSALGFHELAQMIDPLFFTTADQSRRLPMHATPDLPPLPWGQVLSLQPPAPSPGTAGF